MRSIFCRATAATAMLVLPVLIVAGSAMISSAARADGSHETMTGGLFTKFGSETVIREEHNTVRRSMRGGSDRGDRRSGRNRRVASLGGAGGDFSAPKPERSISGGSGVRWAADSGCLNGSLRSVVAAVAASYGAVTVTSTCRSARSNARAGGAPKSYHLSGEAVDLRVRGNISGAAAYMSGLGGGYKHYGGGLFHVDTGPRRPF